jgi:L-alanine-DL-glutamate epimerase-like enolase superfamily enzyme
MGVKTATGDEAAAVAAAIQRFVAETAAPVAAGAELVSPWQRAALLEGVSVKAAMDDISRCCSAVPLP